MEWVGLCWRRSHGRPATCTRAQQGDRGKVRVSIYRELLNNHLPIVAARPLKPALLPHQPHSPCLCLCTLPASPTPPKPSHPPHCQGLQHRRGEGGGRPRRAAGSAPPAPAAVLRAAALWHRDGGGRRVRAHPRGGASGGVSGAGGGVKRARLRRWCGSEQCGGAGAMCSWGRRVLGEGCEPTPIAKFLFGVQCGWALSGRMPGWQLAAVSKLPCRCNAMRSSMKGQSAPVAYMLRLAGSDSGRLVTSVHTCGCWMGVVGAALLVRAGVGAAAPDRLHSVTVCGPDSDPLSPCWAAFPSLPRCSYCHGLRPVNSAGAPPVC